MRVWIDALIIVYVIAYLVSIAFVELNIWNLLFRVNILFTIIGLAAALLMNYTWIISRLQSLKIRSAVFVALLAASFGTVFGPWNIVALVFGLVALYVAHAPTGLSRSYTNFALRSTIMITVAVAAIAALGNMFFLPKPTSVIYPLTCVPASDADPTCVMYQTSFQHAFTVNASRGYIISWTYHAVPVEYSVVRACKIQSIHTWECTSSSGQEIYGEKDGVFYEYGTEQSAYKDLYKGMLYVTQSEWEERNGGPEPEYARTAHPLLCAVFGEYCYGV